MDFVELKSKDEEYHILKSQIGHWSVKQQHCDYCGFDHYVLEVYDKNNNVLCSLNGSDRDKLIDEIEKYYPKSSASTPVATSTSTATSQSAQKTALQADSTSIVTTP